MPGSGGRAEVDELAGALFTGQISRWTCHWLTVTIQAEWGRICDQEVAIARDRFLNGRHVRIKFLCLACDRGCRILHGVAVHGFVGPRHKDRWAPSLDRLLSLRRRIELGHPLHGWSKRRLRKALLAYERDVAESLHGFVVELDARLGHGRHDANVRNHRGGSA
jgi:hypothetical protein